MLRLCPLRQRRCGLRLMTVSPPTLLPGRPWFDILSSPTEILRRADQARRLRFISDNARWESSSGSGLPYSDFLNLSAGVTILRYLRGRQFTTPVLIFTGASINLTHYVLSYWNTGSTWYDDIVSRYIEALRSGRDDRSWIGFNVEPSYTNDAE